MSVDWKAMYEQALRKKGEAFDRAVRAERERDAAVARAEALDKQLAKVMSDYQDLEDEREEIADQFATFCAEIVAEAVKAREAAEREPTVPASQLRAFARLCGDGGDMTPAAARMLDRIIDGNGSADQ